MSGAIRGRDRISATSAASASRSGAMYELTRLCTSSTSRTSASSKNAASSLLSWAISRSVEHSSRPVHPPKQHLLTRGEQSHQNKFHAASLKQLTQKFAAMREGDLVTPADRELFEYFATLYKNSNKGIKGRGKDRKIAGTSGRAFKSDGTRNGGGGFTTDGSRKSESPSSVHSHTSSSAHGPPTHHDGSYDFSNAAAEMELHDQGSVEAAAAAAAAAQYAHAQHHSRPPPMHAYPSGVPVTTGPPPGPYGYAERKMY